jgi:hypothetical protein
VSAIPVCSFTGQVLYHVDACLAASLPHVIQLRNRRGYVKRIVLRAVSPWTMDLIKRNKPSNWGEDFEQELTVGQVWALRGVRGSEKASH